MRLDKLDDVAFGIFDLEVQVAGFAFADFGGDGDVAGGKIGAHLFGVGDDKRDVAKVARTCRRLLVEELDVLVVVDLDEGDVDAAVGVLEVVGFVVAEEAVPESKRFWQIGDEVAGMGDAKNLRPGYGCRLCKEGTGEQHAGQNHGGVLD